jgi:hypothetical protein
LRYFWDFEFGAPQASVDAGHHCYWGDTLLMVNRQGRAILESLGLPIDFYPTELCEGGIPDGLVPDTREFFWALSQCSAVADSVASKNEVCVECGAFTTRRRATARLRIPESDVPAAGVFMVRQNGSRGPTFVTERTKELLCDSGLKGLGFYSAGSRMF